MKESRHTKIGTGWLFIGQLEQIKQICSDRNQNSGCFEGGRADWEGMEKTLVWGKWLCVLICIHQAWMVHWGSVHFITVNYTSVKQNLKAQQGNRVYWWWWEGCCNLKWGSQRRLHRKGDSKKVRENTLRVSGGRTFQAERTAGTKALRGVCNCSGHELIRKVVYEFTRVLQQSTTDCWGLRQPKLIFLLFWRSEVWDQGVCRVGFF